MDDDTELALLILFSSSRSTVFLVAAESLGLGFGIFDKRVGAADVSRAITILGGADSAVGAVVGGGELEMANESWGKA